MLTTIFGLGSLIGKMAVTYSGLSIGAKALEKATGVPVHAAPAAFLNTAGKDIGQIVGGVVRPVMAVAGIDVGGMAVGEDAGERVADVLDPFHVVTDNPADQRDAEKKKKEATQKKLKNSKKKLAETQQSLDAASAAATAADAKAADYDQQAQKAEADANVLAGKLKKAQAQAKLAKALTLRNQAQAARRYAELSRQTAADAKKVIASYQAQLAQMQADAQAAVADIQSESDAAVAQAKKEAADAKVSRQLDSQDATMMQAFKLAQSAMSTATAAKSPPTDARAILRSDTATDGEKATLAYTIDAVNRTQEPDYNALKRQLVPTVDFDEIDAMNDDGDSDLEAAGHDHDHAHGSCDCAKTGVMACDPCRDAAARTNLNTGWGEVPGGTQHSFLGADWSSPAPSKPTHSFGDWGEDEPAVRPFDAALAVAGSGKRDPVADEILELSFGSGNRKRRKPAYPLLPNGGDCTSCNIGRR
jgi:hypothetical protein